MALGGVPEVMETHVLTRLNPADLAMFARVSRACRRAVIGSALERDGTNLSSGFKVEDFVAGLY